jgi:hypothetical protein
MKKLFRIPIYLGIILVLAGLIGCSNPLDPPQETSAPLTGERVVVNKGGVVGITINSVTDLQAIGTTLPLNGNYTLAADLTLTNWVPIGDATNPFTGTFDGAGHILTLQSFDSSALEGSYLGIFGYVAGTSAANKAALGNINIVSSVDESEFKPANGQAVGLLAGYTENTVVDGITVSGTFDYVSPVNIYVGGIVGYAHTGTVIQYSVTSVDMVIDGGSGGGLVTNMFYNTVGGIVGLFKDGVDILNCHNTGDVSAVCTPQGAQVFCGGIAGGSFYYFTTDYQGRIENCSSTDATILAQCSGFWSWAGGIAGCIVGGDNETLANTTRIVRCWATGTVSVEDSPAGWPYVGGIVAYNYYGALVSRCYFDGEVLSNTDGNYTGGIAGYNSQTGGHNSTIEDCWSAGTVTGLHNAGGIVGQNQVNTYVRRCYSTATVATLDDCSINKATTNPGLGGIAGFNASAQTDSITACVAFNTAIDAGSGDMLHRIVGNDTSKTLSNNYGLNTLIPITGGGSIYTPDKGLDRPDGEDVANYPDQSFYEKQLGWNFTDVWMMGASGYPILQ